MTKHHVIVPDIKRRKQRGKSSYVYKPDPPELNIVSVKADSVPFGESISRNGRTVWAAFHNGQLAAVAETADAARRKYRVWKIGGSLRATIETAD
jgi:hypothetical protein